MKLIPLLLAISSTCLSCPVCESAKGLIKTKIFFTEWEIEREILLRRRDFDMSYKVGYLDAHQEVLNILNGFEKTKPRKSLSNYDLHDINERVEFIEVSLYQMDLDPENKSLYRSSISREINEIRKILGIYPDI